MTRPRHPTLLAFSACVLAVLAALSWVTWHALRLEAREQHARAEAHQQEAVRLALWRMDSTVAALIAREAARPYFEYQPFYPADRAYTRMWEQLGPRDVLVPSPLLAGGEEFVRLYFQRGSDGELSSPQAPAGTMRELASQGVVEPTQIAAAEERLHSLSTLFGTTSEAKDKARRAEDDRLSYADKETERAKNQAGGAPTAGWSEKHETGRFSGEAQVVAPAPPPTSAPAAQTPSQREYEVRQQVAEQSASNKATRGGAQSSDTVALNVPTMKSADAKLAPESVARLARMRAAVPPPAKPDVLTTMTPAPPASPPTASEPGPAAPTTVARSPSDQYNTPSSSGEARRDEDGVSELLTKRAGLVGGKQTTDGAGAGVSGIPGNGALEHAHDLPLTAFSAGVPIDIDRFAPRWLADGRELVFTREVRIGDSRSEQGLWVDWPALHASLLSSIKDLLPGARLVPIVSESPGAQDVGSRLASVPAVLSVSGAPPAPSPRWTPMRSVLVLTWIGVLASVGAIALVLRAATELAERRGRFVSAVTHELRTPLTTFCMYSQMLADGMVPPGEPTGQYHRTLKSESQRLAGIVESVLEYARLGRAGRASNTELLTVAELFARLEPSLSRRAAQAGMDLVVESRGPTDTVLRTDPAKAERVIFNLVDNACKYAAQSPDKRVHLSIRVEDKHALFSVSDHGPGIPQPERAQVFRPFFRGARQADGSVPGLGLGLALAHGLARDLGGALDLTDPACAMFTLRIPLSEA